MYRNLIGASSALALLALLTGAPASGIAHEDGKLCNVILDGDGEPVLESDSDKIAHSNSSDCPDESSVENVAVERDTAAVDTSVAASITPLDIYFDVGQDELDAGAQAELDAYAKALLATSPSSLEVVGFTDTSGSADLNAKLSAARAESVVAALANAGVPADMIETGAEGEGELAVQTPDDTREANNRRVTITPAY